MEPKQGALELPFPELGGDQPLIPVRMLNEHVYCPRLAYLEWVQGEWADSADTVDGRHKHQRVDKPSGDLPDAATAEAEHAEIHARSVTLSSNRLGLIAKLDLIEGDQTLFVRRDEVEAQWAWTDAIRAGWTANDMKPKSYASGSWGPSTSIALTERDGVTWQDD